MNSVRAKRQETVRIVSGLPDYRQIVRTRGPERTRASAPLCVLVAE